MATKKELAAEIEKLAPGTDTGDKTHAELEVMLQEIKAADDNQDGDKNDAPAPAPAPAAKPAEVKGTHVVSAGKSITTKRGIMGEGDSLSARDLNGGRETLDRLVKAGFLTAV